MASYANHLEYLISSEVDQILQQLDSPTCIPDCQVFWSGLFREQAQQWADKHMMQTLTTVMGPLMEPEHPSCLKLSKGSQGWSKYIKGASILFAQHVAKNSKSVMVLCAPPPDKLHPTGLTNYQTLEEPILKGCFGSAPVSRIDMCHPLVPGAEDYWYEAWPNDNTQEWVERYGTATFKSRTWRKIRVKPRVGVCGPSLLSDTCAADRAALPAAKTRKQESDKQRQICEGCSAPAGKVPRKVRERAKKACGRADFGTPTPAAQKVGMVANSLDVATQKSIKTAQNASECSKKTKKAATKADTTAKKAIKTASKASECSKKTKKAATKADTTAKKVIKTAPKASECSKKTKKAAKKAEQASECSKKTKKAATKAKQAKKVEKEQQIKEEKSLRRSPGLQEKARKVKDARSGSEMEANICADRGQDSSQDQEAFSTNLEDDLLVRRRRNMLISDQSSASQIEGGRVSALIDMFEALCRPVTPTSLPHL